MRIDFSIIDNLWGLSENFLGIPFLEQINKGAEDKYRRFLYHLIKEFCPKLSLEIGVAAGITSVFMSKASDDYKGRVIGMDINDPIMFPIRDYFFAKGNSTKLDMSELIEKMGPLELVFQDSSHHYQETKEEWCIYTQYINHGLWICDDISDSFEGMTEYFSELPEPKKLYPYKGNNIGVIII
jgi:predicted O-methyltransferase YrrM